ncbi:hypothetical protein A6769_23485 [Nostoc punctiforme NIES-2108]|uniref:DUF7380 domain-containing protein n=1 Tax=Nostoc punctiforme NIES-2108 TaxID=1356359 RepID=A0A367RF54_NOSPU|nr:hypothetical protein A6769_23485 [Nostoc punctiforme NIES-2108]
MNLVPQFELSDFDKYQWTEILDKKIPKECQNYSEEFRIKSEAYKLSGDRIAQEIFKFLSEITSLLMEPQSLPAVEEMITSALSDHHLAILTLFYHSRQSIIRGDRKNTRQRVWLSLAHLHPQ